MIVDYKPKPDSTAQQNTFSRASEASTSERKLAIELPSLQKIYTAGSLVAGIVRLGSKEPERIKEIQISLVGVVRSIHHRHLGGVTWHDIRRETTKLIHRDQTLWSSKDGDDSVPPSDLPFEIILPDVGNDRRACDPETRLPPSFHAGRRRGLRNITKHGSPIGYIKYYAKVSLIRKGTLTRKQRAIAPFIFLPPSPPPFLLPTVPESISVGDFCLPDNLWQSDNTSTNIRNKIFSPIGQAKLELWMPRVPSFPRLTPVPFFLCFTLQTRRIESEPPTGELSEGVLLPLPHLDKASMFLRQTIRSCARGGKQSHRNTLNASPTDNMLHGVTAEEGAWTAKSICELHDQVGYYWEKQFVWRGLWTFRETPNFMNRQLSCEYALVAEIPVKGLGNGVTLVSRAIEVGSGVTQGDISLALSSEQDMLDLPPDYFEEDRTGSDHDHEADQGKS